MIKKIEAITEYVVKFTDEECAKLNIKEGDKFTIRGYDDGTIELEPYSTIDIDLKDYSREHLIYLIQESCNRDVSVNEIITDAMMRFVEENEKEI